MHVKNRKYTVRQKQTKRRYTLLILWLNSSACKPVELIKNKIWNCTLYCSSITSVSLQMYLVHLCKPKYIDPNFQDRIKQLGLQGSQGE